MKLRLKIDNYENRVGMISALAQSGYKTWVEEEKVSRGLCVYDYYVCFNLKDKSEYSGNKIGN